MARPDARSIRLVLLLSFSAALAAIPAGALGQEQKPTVPAADYGKWEYLGGGTLSPAGDWITQGLPYLIQKERFGTSAPGSPRSGDGR